MPTPRNNTGVHPGVASASCGATTIGGAEVLSDVDGVEAPIPRSTIVLLAYHVLATSLRRLPGPQKVRTVLTTPIALIARRNTLPTVIPSTSMKKRMESIRGPELYAPSGSTGSTKIGT